MYPTELMFWKNTVVIKYILSSAAPLKRSPKHSVKSVQLICGRERPVFNLFPPLIPWHDTSVPPPGPLVSAQDRSCSSVWHAGSWTMKTHVMFLAGNVSCLTWIKTWAQGLSMGKMEKCLTGKIINDVDMWHSSNMVEKSLNVVDVQFWLGLNQIIAALEATLLG